MLGAAAALIVRLYQLTLSRILPQRCRFHPSCSQYAVESLRAYGLLRGGALAMWRLMRCGPWAKAGYDPVPVLQPGPLRRTARALRSRLATHDG